MIAHPEYSEIFYEPLENEPVRVPLTTDPSLFADAVALGERLLWLHTFGTRYTSSDRPPGRVPRRECIGWTKEVTMLPGTLKDIGYDPDAHELHIGDGVVSGVSSEVRKFEISGLNVLDKWLGARTAKGIGKSAQKTATPLDKIRPTEWEDDWNDELLDLLRVLTTTVEIYPAQEDLLDAILAGPLIEASELPTPDAAESLVPATIKRSTVIQEELN